MIKFYNVLKIVANKLEVHIFSTDGHSFGVKKQGATSNHLIDEFYY